MERSAYRRLVLHGHPINRHAYFELADVQDVAAWAETLLQEKPDGRRFTSRTFEFLQAVDSALHARNLPTVIPIANLFGRYC